MKEDAGGSQPLRIYFHQKLQSSLTEDMMLRNVDEVQECLDDLLVTLLTQESMAAVDSLPGNEFGCPSSDAFAREIEVRKHIGDLMLLGSGLFPAIFSPEATTAAPLGGFFLANTAEYGRWAEEAVAARQQNAEFREFQLAMDLFRLRLAYA